MGYAVCIFVWMWVVTGATGFVGYHFLAWWWEAGRPFPLRLLVRKPDHPYLKPYYGHLEIYQADLAREDRFHEAVRGAEGILHMAATISFSPRARSYMQRTNVLATRHLVNAALEENVPKFIYLSSIAALGRPADLQSPIDENTTWTDSPYNTWYGYTKYAGEKEVWRGHAEGLSVFILNPGIILGPYPDWTKGSPYFFKAIWQGLRFYPKGINGFVGVQDVVSAIAWAIAHHPTGWDERYIAVAENLSYRQVFTWIAEALGKRPPNWPLPPTLAYALGWTMEKLHKILGLPAVITRETARTSSQNFHYDGSKLVKRTGRPYTLIREVIAQTAKVFLQSHGDRAQRRAAAV
jgi:dihydroflavonol-4-reductase